MAGNKRKIATDQRRETKKQRSVSFTKRRQGLYNKAVELCLFCGAQIAIVVSSPNSGRNLYSFGHSSVDAVFDAFLEGRPPYEAGDGVGGAARSLYEEIKALERQTDDERRKRMKKSNNQSDEFWREIEVFEKNCDSVEELQVLVNNLEKLKEKALNRLTMMAVSDSLSSSNLFNSADNFACLDENCNTNVVDFGAVTDTEYIPSPGCFNNNQDHVNCNVNAVNEIDTFSGCDYINVDENYKFSGSDEYKNVLDLADFDSISHILDSFTVDDDEYYNNSEGLFCPFFDVKPE
ncbi:hypothetical protein JRO89_XS08G0101600 [Xanthoceras sorbifolium]|uniref:MADS-box domain-containing protein n=1 Tax=Xanthoceras sorbifolium TaxID=99658 RepID=A0ABQ8HP82_9ROSI|nr:hypothetical protein JRO89_XS08G0101600 [Xanthoceras sorbifolium]